MNINGVKRRWRLAAIAVVAGSVLLSSGCGDGKKASWQGGAEPGSSAGAQAGDPSPAPTQSTVAVTSPAADATGVVAITDGKDRGEDPENTTVTVTGPGGKEIGRTLDKDAKVWKPAKALAWNTKYTVTVKGTEAEGKGGTTTSTFTTMAKPSKQVRVTSFLGDGQTVGVDMPLIV